MTEDQIERAKKSARKSVKKLSWRLKGIVNPDGSPFTLIDYDRAYQVQQGRCRGCLTHQSDMKRALAADHDHATNFFRGLLCIKCNYVLGLVTDDIAVLERLKYYLQGSA